MVRTQPIPLNPDGSIGPEDAPEANHFIGVGMLVVEIEACILKLVDDLDNLKQGQKAHSAVQQKLAGDEISKTSGQIKTLSDCLVRVSCNHINRRPR
jgi:hypothetical protein